MDVEKWVGVTRPVVTLSLIWTLCYLVIISVKPDSIDFKDFISLVMIVALFWFKSRDEEKKDEQIAKVVSAATGTGAGTTTTNGVTAKEDK